jgi:hypothetical protein
MLLHKQQAKFIQTGAWRKKRGVGEYVVFLFWIQQTTTLSIQFLRSAFFLTSFSLLFCHHKKGNNFFFSFG